MSDIPILLLAAGSSSRMRGRDKLMELIDGQPLVARQARAARAATDGPVLVALPPAPHPRLAALKGLDVTPVPVADAAEGMGVSLSTGIRALPDDARAVMVLLADLPELTTADLQTVLQAVEDQPGHDIWRGATMDGAPGHPIVFAAPMFPELAALGGDEGGRSVVAAAGNAVCTVPLPGQRALADLDTPEAWAAWRAARGD
ncbi:MAG: 4-diphosphocytidyl-2C-methyl-D-erythritol synthase [Rhodobacteraceae bacterium]|nr:4-diphosphocytidyl-2C-methyl-D-erythritol synthase [Paracoccaceae bacterium]